MTWLDGAGVFAVRLPYEPTSAAEVPWDALGAADHLHLGGPELLGPNLGLSILSFAREHGLSTSVDLLAGLTRELRPDQQVPAVR